MGGLFNLEEVGGVSCLDVGSLAAVGDDESIDKPLLGRAEEYHRSQCRGRLAERAYGLQRATEGKCLVIDALKALWKRDLREAAGLEGQRADGA